MQPDIEFEIRFPKGFRMKDIRTDDIKLDERWMVTVRRDHHNIDFLPLYKARRIYG